MFREYGGPELPGDRRRSWASAENNVKVRIFRARERLEKALAGRGCLCVLTGEILSAYLDGEIGAPWDRAIEEHLASCADCRSLYDGCRVCAGLSVKTPLPDWRRANGAGAPEQPRARCSRAAPEPAVWRAQGQRCPFPSPPSRPCSSCSSGRARCP